ncbi:MAG: hypothetical protein C0501_12760 [Isosphaera sp.]|nr:hypothetical protein [Isosphaera sp.]
MADDNPLTVFVAENAQVADAVIGLLAGAGIPADAVVPPAEASSDPLTGASEVVWRRNEFEVRVRDGAQAGAAKELLDGALAAAAVRAVRERRAGRTGTVAAVCEECGAASEWAAAEMGTTQDCPHCGAYMDIPDPDDDWSGVDTGADDEEDGDGPEPEEGKT